MLFHERLSYHEDFNRRLKTEKKFKIRPLGDFIDDLCQIEVFVIVLKHSISCLMKLMEKEIRMQTKNFLHHTSTISTKLLFPYNC